MVKTSEEIEKIRVSCRKCKLILNKLGELVEPGVSTMDIEEYLKKLLKSLKAEPAFMNYNGYPANLCISVNEEVVHGIPSEKKVLKEGDIVSIDIGLIVDGYYSDYADTFGVGRISRDCQKLMDVARESFKRGVSEAYPGKRTGDIGNAIQTYVEREKCSVIREFVGHGIGCSLHEPPEIPNFGVPGRGEELEENTVIAIEPMVAIGDWDVEILGDGWTVVTKDRSYSAHYEECVLITEKGPELLAY